MTYSTNYREYKWHRIVHEFRYNFSWEIWLFVVNNWLVGPLRFLVNFEQRWLLWSIGQVPSFLGWCFWWFLVRYAFKYFEVLLCYGNVKGVWFFFLRRWNSYDSFWFISVYWLIFHDDHAFFLLFLTLFDKYYKLIW